MDAYEGDTALVVFGLLTWIVVFAMLGGVGCAVFAALT